jgi:hypothetical protein
MISQRQCMRPRLSVEPMYMPGRLRTASRPSSIPVGSQAGMFKEVTTWVLQLLLKH